MTVLPDMIGMVVRDMAAALRFYRALGLDLPAELDQESHAEVITPNGYRLAWDTEELIKSIDSEWQPPVGQRIALAFKCGSPAEVDEVYARLIKEGYRSASQPWDAFWGQRYAQVYDPDGNKVDLFASL